MRVALIGPYPADTSKMPGGVAAVTYYVAQALAAVKDVELHVLAPHKDYREDRTVEIDGARVRYLRIGGHPLLPNLIASVGRAAEVLGEIKPDVVHGESAVGTLAGLKAGFPTVHTIHGVAHREVRYHSGVRPKLGVITEGLMLIRAVSRVKHCIATSNYAADAYKRFTHAKIHYIFNPVEDTFFEMPNAEVPNTMFSAARMTPLKNPLGLVRAFRIIHEHNPDAELFLAGKIGQPGYYARIEDCVRENALESRVHLLGFVSEDELEEHFKKASVVCLFSFVETAPVLLAQAMCAGKPVVTSAAGGSQDLVIDGETGFVVGVGDEQAFAEKSLILLGDADLRARMGKRVREVAEQRFRKEVVAAKTIEVYREAISKG